MKTLKEIVSYREMIFSLVRRDLRGRYKGSVLGFLWTFINPLLQMLVYTIVFSVIMKNPMERYYLHLFVALVPWIFFSTCITAGSKCIISQKDMVKKIYFPREVLPIAFTTSQFVNMLFSFIVIFTVVIISGVGISLKACAFLPIVMLSEYILAMGMTFIISGLTVYFKDLEYILTIFSMLWMYLTPVVYGISSIPEQYMFLFNINPMTPIIVAYREILYYKSIPDIGTILHVLAVGVGILAIGCIVFPISKRRFAEEL